MSCFLNIKNQDAEKRVIFTFLFNNFVEISRFFSFCDILTVERNQVILWNV